MASESLTEDVINHVHFVLGETPAAERRRSHWVMSMDWLNEVRKADQAAHYWYWTGIGTPETLLGLPIEVRDDGGVPHLESDGHHAAITHGDHGS